MVLSGMTTLGDTPLDRHLRQGCIERQPATDRRHRWVHVLLWVAVVGGVAISTMAS